MQALGEVGALTDRRRLVKMLENRMDKVRGLKKQNDEGYTSKDC